MAEAAPDYKVLYEAEVSARESDVNTAADIETALRAQLRLRVDDAAEMQRNSQKQRDAAQKVYDNMASIVERERSIGRRELQLDLIEQGYERKARAQLGAERERLEAMYGLRLREAERTIVRTQEASELVTRKLKARLKEERRKRTWAGGSGISARELHGDVRGALVAKHGGVEDGVEELELTIHDSLNAATAAWVGTVTAGEFREALQAQEGGDLEVALPDMSRLWVALFGSDDGKRVRTHDLSRKLEQAFRSIDPLEAAARSPKGKKRGGRKSRSIATMN